MKAEDITIEDYMAIKQIANTFKEEDKIEQQLIKYFKLGDTKIEEAKDFLLKVAEYMTLDTEFIQRFTLNGVEYGFIPNFDNITAAEWIDLELYENDDNNIHRLMSILYRPVKRSFRFWKKDYYEVDKYTGTTDIMLKAPAAVYLGCIVFFYLLKRDLLNHISICIDKEMKMKKD